jgi:putative PIN family toxin of toxin-antitoxin system
LRFVLDTNVVISALLLPRSIPRQSFDKAIDQGEILLSLPILTELNDVLSRKRFDRYLSEEERMRFLAALVKQAKLIEITETITECRDAKDNMFLELAVSGNADCIISGDQDLLVLHPFRAIPILTPTAFLSSF